MPKKYLVIIKSIGRKWFLFLIAIILIIAIYNVIPAIWMLSITLVLFSLSYIPTLLFKRKLRNFLNKYYKIEDELVARKFKKTLQKIQDDMFELSQQQEKKSWLIVFLNKQYIFYHEKTIAKFEEVYNKGFTEKEILDNLKDYKVTTRAEIKAIQENLVKLNRLSEREISVKEHKQKQKFA
ncbi:MAG: hypothetical protein ACFFE5_09065 [Candidatus Thorarchaeota archaeon]